MKRKTYQICIATLSLIMILAASCGRSEEQGTPDTTTAVSETTAAVETPYISDVIISKVSVCAAANGTLTVIERDGTVVSIPYDAETAAITLADGIGKVSVGNFGIGTQLRIYHRAGEPGTYGEIVRIEMEEQGEPVLLHGIVCRTGETILVHPEPWRVLDVAGVDPAECYEIPLTGVPIGNRLMPTEPLSTEELKVGDFVQIRHSERMASARKPYEVYCALLCNNITEQMTVREISNGLNRIILEGTAISRRIFDEGHVLDASGNAVAFEDISVGDLFEVQHGGEILQSAPSQFGHLHVLRRIKTAAQIEAEQAAQAVFEALTKPYTLRGTVRVFESGAKLIWFGETVAPEDINYFSCTTVGGLDYTITDAATEQTLTWDDLQDGDYVAVEGSGGIAESGPSQWYGVRSITRLARLCHEGTVSAVAPDGVTITLRDGTSRRVSVEVYYVSGVRFDIDSLAVGDTVRLDVNALDETEVYALHLLDRETQIPAGAVTETFRVRIVTGMDIYLVRDLTYDTTQIHIDEKGIEIQDGDVSFDVKRIFYDTDGSVRSVKQLRRGDLITVTYSSLVTEFDPAEFETIYQIIRVVE